MAKLRRVIEFDGPGGEVVHFGSVGVQDAVTLCYTTDWLQTDKRNGEETRKAVTCTDCIRMVKAIQSADKEKL